MTEFHDYTIPEHGQIDWHRPINDNFRQLDRDVEIRDVAANRSRYDPTEGVKFLATDTGRIYIGDGSAWQPLASPAGARTPNIVCYESDGIAYAETPARTFTGPDIFDATQQAIDARIAETREEFRSVNNFADIHVFIKPGYYEVSNTLTVTEKGLERLTIETAGTHGAVFDTSGVSAGETVIEIDPGPVEQGDFRDRIWMVSVLGIRLEDENHDRDQTGIYINDVSFFRVENGLLRGFERGLWLRNVWQGTVDDLWVNRCGSSSASTPCIQVGHPNDTETHRALNHVQFNHLQGDPIGGGLQHAYFQAQGKATRIDISYPNVELGEEPGFVFDGTDGQMRVQMRGCQLTGGDPAVEAAGSDTYVYVSGGQIDSDGTAVTASNLTLQVGGGIRLKGAGDRPALKFSGFGLGVGNALVQGGNRGIVVEDVGYGHIGTVSVINSTQAGLKVTGDARNLSVSNLSLRYVSGSGETPVYLDGVNNSLVTNVIGTPEREVDVVRCGDCTNVLVDNILPAGSASGSVRDDGGNTLR